MYEIRLGEILKALVFDCTRMETATTKRTSVAQMGECETKRIELRLVIFVVASQKKPKQVAGWLS